MAFVYIFQSREENYFKIGRTKNDVEKRRKALSTGNPKELKLFDLIEKDFDSDVENYLHKRFFMNYSKEGDSRVLYIIEKNELKLGILDAREYEKKIIPIKHKAIQNSSLESNGKYINHNDAILELTKELFEVKGQINWLKIKNDILESRLKNIIGSNEGIRGVASWKTVSRVDFNKSNFKNEHPELHDEFLEEKNIRTFKLLI